MPVYPSVKGLHQNKIRQLISLALSTAAGVFSHLNDDEFKQAKLPFQGDLMQALYAIHFPKPLANLQEQLVMINQLKNRQHQACQRIIVEEFTAHQLAF